MVSLPLSHKSFLSVLPCPPNFLAQVQAKKCVVLSHVSLLLMHPPSLLLPTLSPKFFLAFSCYWVLPFQDGAGNLECPFLWRFHCNRSTFVKTAGLLALRPFCSLFMLLFISMSKYGYQFLSLPCSFRLWFYYLWGRLMNNMTLGWFQWRHLYSHEKFLFILFSRLLSIISLKVWLIFFSSDQFLVEQIMKKRRVIAQSYSKIFREVSMLWKHVM